MFSVTRVPSTPSGNGLHLLACVHSQAYRYTFCSIRRQKCERIENRVNDDCKSDIVLIVIVAVAVASVAVGAMVRCVRTKRQNENFNPCRFEISLLCLPSICFTVRLTASTPPIVAGALSRERVSQKLPFIEFGSAVIIH